MLVRVTADGQIAFAGERVRCALGRGGIRIDKREGDGATPAGRFPFRRLHYRADRLSRPACGLPTRIIRKQDGWCDDPAHQRYNTLIERPFSASHEHLWRNDVLYDLVVEIGHNDRPPVPGAGSAIFIHVATPDYAPTDGCVALDKDDLIRLLYNLGPEDAIEIGAET